MSFLSKINNISTWKYFGSTLLALAILGALGKNLEITSAGLIAMFWVICVLALLTFGNLLISQICDRFYPWGSSIPQRFFIQLGLSTIYTLISLNLSYYLFKISSGLPPDGEQFLLLNIYGLLFLIPILSIIFGVYFMAQWRKSYAKHESLKREHLRTQFESLRAHLDPHFLFNSLNILYSLIERDRNSALDFLDNFSEVYRYVLQNKDQELVPLKKELQFIEAYSFLLKKRFGDQLSLDIEIPKEALSRYIPPMAIQMLIENAIKHNKISGKVPLALEVKGDVDEIWVRNNLQKKTTPNVQNSMGFGLENIQKRYAYVSDRFPQIENNGKIFEVRLPLLSMQPAI